MAESRIGKALNLLNSPVKHPPIVWTQERIKAELAKALLPIVRRQRREAEERAYLEQEARELRGTDCPFLAVRLGEIETRLAEITPITPPEQPRSQKQRREYRRRLSEELAELRRRADRSDEDPAWATLLGWEMISERRAQMAERS